MITATDLKLIFIIFYDNNPSGFNQAFANNGYSIPSTPVQAKKYVVGQMYDLYLNNPSKLKQIMDSVGWDNNNTNYTNQGNVRQTILNYLKSNIQSTATSKVDWGSIGSLLFGNHDTVSTQVTSTPVQSSTSTLAIIGYIFLGIMVVVLVIVSVRMLRR